MRRQDWIRLTIVVVLVAVITVLHYQTTIAKVHFHDIYRRLYYVPIVLGGLWFTLRGGVGTALVVSLLFIPHVVIQWGHHPTADPEQYLEIILYNVIGFLTGLLAERELRQKLSYQSAARRLEESYAELRRQADLILDIEDQLRRADRLSALGELSAGMAHEIRNPLGSIRGTAEILQDGIDPADPRYEFTRILIKEVDRLNRVVQDFLDFARPPTPLRASVDPVAVLREVLQLTRQLALKNGVEVSLDADAVSATVAGEEEQLKQAFLNLVLNALQAMPTGGTLTIAAGSEGGEVQLRFRDSGPGIPLDLQEKIFNPFFTTRREGTGLGLAITQRIVSAHGGRLEVASAMGAGSTFILALPAEKHL
ncbi:MAG: histidine kinase [Desulfuromonadales bacterium GWC2_61_20]|nr:MAG: histidine kinase [Desulfuromonadales bacterium GWC2_61_20]HAD05377.1 sensor histidine kinase [Desulfuromonas sp.]